MTKDNFPIDTSSAFNLIKTQFLPLNGGFKIVQTATLDKNSKAKFEISLGDADVEYSNEIAKAACEMVLMYKQLYLFKYIPMANLINKRDNVHRKI